MEDIESILSNKTCMQALIITAELL